MRYVRFMSLKELKNYKAGKKLKNHRKWRDSGSRCSSKGFCFFDDSVPPEKRIEYLTGVVTMEVVAVFEPVGGKKLTESYGFYRDPKEDKPEYFWDAMFTVPPAQKIIEYCTEEYSEADMKLVKAGIVLSAFHREIEWIL